MTKRNINAILYKEYLLLRGNLRRYLGLALAYWLFAFLGLYPLWLAVMMGQLLFILAPISLFSQEEGLMDTLFLCDKGRYLSILGRFLSGICLCLFATVGNLCALVLWQILGEESITLPLMVLLFSSIWGLLLLCATLPLFFLLGKSRGKPWFFLLVLIPLALCLLWRPWLWTSWVVLWVISLLFLGVGGSFAYGFTQKAVAEKFSSG